MNNGAVLERVWAAARRRISNKETRGRNRSTVRHTIISHPLRERHTLVRSQLPGSVVLGSDAGEPSLDGCYRLPAVAVLRPQGVRSAGKAIAMGRQPASRCVLTHTTVFSIRDYSPVLAFLQQHITQDARCLRAFVCGTSGNAESSAC